MLIISRDNPMKYIPPKAAKKATGMPKATQIAILPFKKTNKTNSTNTRPVNPLSMSMSIRCLTESAKTSYTTMSKL